MFSSIRRRRREDDLGSVNRNWPFESGNYCRLAFVRSDKGSVFLECIFLVVLGRYNFFLVMKCPQILFST